jgi:nucleoside-diphosphate-sugar epimerase
MLIRRVLVFGGNGFIGAETVELLVQLGDDVTIVNRGNWYWDSKLRIAPRVDVISCDRKNGVKSCDDLVQLVKDVGELETDAGCSL